MSKRKLTLIALVSVLTSGCSAWPELGIGGMAEHYLQSITQFDDSAKANGATANLAMEHDILARHLDMLVQEGAELCFPATVEQGRQRQARIARGLQGGLAYDAANDMVLQRHLLARLERQLDYVVQQNICTLPATKAQQTPGELASRIDELLNADNQFAVDSSEINPKFLGRLAEAAALLKEQPHYHVQVTGHADSLGSDQHNQALSLARAEQVSRYLQIFGLPMTRITVSAVSANEPLFSGSEPEVRLTNRRVSIDLIEAGVSVAQHQGVLK